MREKIDATMYLRALAVFARNTGVIVAPLIAAAIAIGLQYAQGPLFDPSGGFGIPLMGLIVNLLYGFAFGVAVIFADDAWRHGTAHIASAWTAARGRAGNILIASLGFFFLIYVAGLVGGIIHPYLGMLLQIAAVWAFIYAIPAAAIGGVPGGAVFSVSLQAAKRNPIATALLVIVSLVVWIGLTNSLLGMLGGYFGLAALDVAQLLLFAIALGYIALITAKQYADCAFRPYW